MAKQREHFWQLPHSSKLDVLTEGAYDKVITQALCDPETQIGEEIDKRYTVIYGNEQALLIDHSSITLIWTLRLLRTFLSITRN